MYALYLAVKDWLHERTLSLCAVLALASMLAPILILQGVRTGVVEAMREKLLKDPTVLVLSPYAGKESFSRGFIAKLATLPGARFAIGRIREIATDVSLRSAKGAQVPVHMEPCAPGEPVLELYGMPIPRAVQGSLLASSSKGAASKDVSSQDPPSQGPPSQDSGSKEARDEIVLSFRAAEKLGVAPGDSVHALLGRKTREGRFESLKVPLRVCGVLPHAASDRILGFLPLSLMEDMQDYRDDVSVPARAWQGTQVMTEREYASFRLYAKDLDSVEPLTQSLAAEGVEVRTKAHEIAAIRALDQSLQRVIGILALAVGSGFIAFMISSAKGAVRRKLRMLGLLRLFGCTRLELLSYPLLQAFLTSTAGIFLAVCCYCLVSVAIDSFFAAQSGGMTICRLQVQDLCSAVAAVYVLSGLPALYAAYSAASVDPSSVIREI